MKDILQLCNPKQQFSSSFQVLSVLNSHNITVTMTSHKHRKLYLFYKTNVFEEND